jgi:hypothetical protein
METEVVVKHTVVPAKCRYVSDLPLSDVVL